MEISQTSTSGGRSMGVCRCCLSHGPVESMLHVVFTNNRSGTYADMLRTCYSLDIIEIDKALQIDSKQVICDACISSLSDAYNFRMRVECSIATFREQLAFVDVHNSVKVEFATEDEEINCPQDLAVAFPIKTVIQTKKPRMTSAEKTRAYRQRQRDKKMQEKSLNIAQTQNKCVDHKSVQSRNMPSSSTESVIIHKKPRMTSAEKMRAFRQRQREKIMQQNFSYMCDIPSQNDCENYDSKQSSDITSDNTDCLIISKRHSDNLRGKIEVMQPCQHEKYMQNNSPDVAQSQSNSEDVNSELYSVQH